MWQHLWQYKKNDTRHRNLKMAYCQPGKYFKFQKMMANKEKTSNLSFLSKTSLGAYPYKTSHFIWEHPKDLSVSYGQNHMRKDIPLKFGFARFLFANQWTAFYMIGTSVMKKLGHIKLINILGVSFPCQTNYFIISHIEPRNFLRFLCISKI